MPAGQRSPLVRNVKDHLTKKKRLYLIYMYTTAFQFTQAFRGQPTSLRRLSYEATFVLVPGGGEAGKRPLLQGFPSYELRLVVAAP